MRPTFDQVYLQFAEILANRSHHPTTKVGCVIVSQDYSQVLSLGYNGSYSGGPNSPVSEEPGQSGLIHAEANCLIKYNGPRLQNSRLYLTHSPCLDCAKLIINSKAIGEVTYLNEYRDISGVDLLNQNGIKCLKYGI